MGREGDALDSALEAIDDYFESCEDWRLWAQARGLMRGYHARWNQLQKHLKLWKTEHVVTGPLKNPESLRDSRTWKTAGVIDKLAYEGGVLTLFDHKTSSMDIEEGSPYWRQLAVESQPSHYQLLLLMNGVKIGRIVWDVIRKPGIRPRRLYKKECGEIASLGTYCGFDLDSDTIGRVVNEHRAGMEPRECAKLFEFRLSADCCNNPDKYFKRRGISRTANEIVEYSQELWQVGQEIRENAKAERSFKNSGACMLYGSPCQFLDVCSGLDDINSDNWKRSAEVHAEIPEGLEGDSRDYLTNSRIRCYQTCRRKHHYKYSLGIQRFREEEKEALFFGTGFHEGLDVWWGGASDKCD